MCERLYSELPFHNCYRGFHSSPSDRLRNRIMASQGIENQALKLRITELEFEVSEWKLEAKKIEIYCEEQLAEQRKELSGLRIWFDCNEEQYKKTLGDWKEKVASLKHRVKQLHWQNKRERCSEVKCVPRKQIEDLKKTFVRIEDEMNEEYKVAVKKIQSLLNEMKLMTR